MKNKTLKCIILYSFLFCVSFFACVQIYFSLYNKSYIWMWDGIENTYPMFAYIGMWWRKIIKDVFINHVFSLPMFDMSIGYGADIITSFGNGFNNFANPFNIFSILVPVKYSEAAYEVIIVLQMYFSGISFILFSLYKKNNIYSSVGGALVYVFSSTMYIVFKQSTFAYIFVLFPLVILELNRIRDGRKKPYIYILLLVSFFTYSYYFMYMGIILIAGYLLVDSIINIIQSEEKKKAITIEIKLLLRIMVYSIYACMIGLCLLLPSLYYISQTDRLGFEPNIPMFYSKYVNGLLWGGFISAFDGGTDYIIGYSVVALICCIALYTTTKMREYVKAKVLFFVATLMLFLPFAGHIMNGFNYATNRWIWAYAFLVAYIVTIMIDKIYDQKRKNIILTCIVLAIYGVVILFVFNMNEPRYNIPLLVGLFIIIISGVINKKSKVIFQQIYLLLLICTLTIPAFYYFSNKGNNFIDMEVENNKTYDTVKITGGLDALKKLDKTVLFRYDTTIGRLRNASLFTDGACGYDIYNSAYHNGLDRFQKELGIPSSPWVQQINGVDKRSDLEALFGTRYIIWNGDKNIALPYGYNKLDYNYTRDDGYQLSVITSEKQVVLYHSLIKLMIIIPILKRIHLKNSNY